MLGLLVVFLFGILFFLMAQLYTLQQTIDYSDIGAEQSAQKRLEDALKANQEEHKKTQRYLQCVVLLPLQERTEANFKKCGVTGIIENSDGEQKQIKQVAPPPSNPTKEVSSTPDVSTTPPQTNSPSPIVQQPTTSAPPEPEPRRKGLIESTVEGVTGGVRSIVNGLTNGLTSLGRGI